jgi:hypothetical protein
MTLVVAKEFYAGEKNHNTNISDKQFEKMESQNKKE